MAQKIPGPLSRPGNFYFRCSEAEITCPEKPDKQHSAQRARAMTVCSDFSYVSPTKNRLRGAQAVNALFGYISP